MVEAIVATLIVSTMLVAALSALGASVATQRKLSTGNQALLLAQDLLSEIMQQDYEDADYGPGSFGLGSDEVGDGSRALWEDVDDYDGWSASPPEAKDGTPLAGFNRWGRSVQVDWVDSDDLTTVRGSDEGVKLIIVTVTYDAWNVLELTALRTRGADLSQRIGGLPLEVTAKEAITSGGGK
jgi:MSHA pilin protein MshD